MALTRTTCAVCGWHGWFIHHNAERCARYLHIKQMYLSGMSTRAIARELGTSGALVMNVLKGVGVKTRPPGGLNNPGGINGRSRLKPLLRPKGGEAESNPAAPAQESGA